MIEEGLFERFPMQAIYALHNWPSLPAGQVAVRSGAIMAATDRLDIRVRGKGGHGASTHTYRQILCVWRVPDSKSSLRGRP